jgi:hypothetical protein
MNKGDREVLMALLQEQGSALRARSEPEYLFTAAAVAGFGAIFGGIAAAKATDWAALLAMLWVVVIATSVICKIMRENGKYEGLKCSIREILRALNTDLRPATNEVVISRLRDLKKKGEATGFRY